MYCMRYSQWEWYSNNGKSGKITGQHVVITKNKKQETLLWEIELWEKVKYKNRNCKIKLTTNIGKQLALEQKNL